MSASRRARRAKRRTARMDTVAHARRCGHPECSRREIGVIDCLTCEGLAPDQAKRLGYCRAHFGWAQEKMRRHALVGHPVNLLRAAVARLKGDI